MRFIFEVTIPHGKFNAAVKDGTAGAKMQKILEAQKPEHAFFTDNDGCRSGLLIVNLKDASELPALAEPWFLTFDADVRLRLCMTPEDLGKSDLNAMGKKWG
jgi:hypothetical protein